jgi:hypothetical protein
VRSAVRVNRHAAPHKKVPQAFASPHNFSQHGQKARAPGPADGGSAEPSSRHPIRPRATGAPTWPTTRISPDYNPAWGGIADMLPLDPWPRAESVRFLGERRGEADDDRAADRVADALGDLPLALEQAAAYCEQTGTTLSNYADFLEQGYGAELWREPRDLERTVAAVWEVSFSKVEADSPACAVLLHFCAFLAPDNIPLDAIRAGAGAAGAAEGSGRPSGGVQYGGSAAWAPRSHGRTRR